MEVVNKDLYKSFNDIIEKFDLDELFEIQWIGKNTFLKTLELFSRNGYSLSYLIEINNYDNLYCCPGLTGLEDFVRRQIESCGVLNFGVEYLRDISEISDTDIYSIMNCSGVRKNTCRRQDVYLIDCGCVSDDPASGISQDSYNALKSSMAVYTINILLKENVVETILDELCYELDLKFTDFEREMIISGCNNHFRKIPSVVNRILSLKDKGILPKNFNHLIEILENINNLK